MATTKVAFRSGLVLVENGQLVAQGHNRRVQESDPIAHGEMDCPSGRPPASLPQHRPLHDFSPCMMCTGTILQFGIPRVVVGERSNFEGHCDFLAERGVDVVLLDDPDCIHLPGRAPGGRAADR